MGIDEKLDRLFNAHQVVYGPGKGFATLRALREIIYKLTERPQAGLQNCRAPVLSNYERFVNALLFGLTYKTAFIRPFPLNSREPA